MNIYTITQPGQQTVDVQGISIRTQNVTTSIETLSLWGRFASGSGSLSNVLVKLISRLVVGNPGNFTQYAGSPGWCRILGTYNYYDGNCRIQTANYNSGSTNNFHCGSFVILPEGAVIGCSVNRCDIIVTVQNSPLQEIRLQGLNGQPCGTWTTRLVNDCLPTEIKCPDPSDPRGFCCIPCDSLNSKIRALI